MAEGDFLFELALAESAVSPEAIAVSRIELDGSAKLIAPSKNLPHVIVATEASAPEIAARFSDAWGLTIDTRVFEQVEVAPEHVTLAARWREIHRDLSLTGLLRAHDPNGRITAVELNAETAEAVVHGRFNGHLVSVAIPLLDDSYMMWEAMDTFIEQAIRSAGTTGR